MPRTFLKAAISVEETILSYPEQLTEGFRVGAAAAKKMKRTPKAVVFAGMGGSHLAAHIFDSVFGLPVPTTRVRNYTLPSWVDRTTLVVVLSYSGGTEEAVSALTDAKAKGAMTAAIAMGDALERLAKKQRTPFVALPVETNPSGQPRLGLPMMLGTLLGLFHGMGMSIITKGRVEKVTPLLRKKIRTWMRDRKKGPFGVAKKYAKHELLIFSSPRAAGVAHALQNQCNETGKVTAHWHEIPESNHHLLEGLKFPPVSKRPMLALMLPFSGDIAKIQKRMAVTKEVLTRNHIKVETVASDTKDVVLATAELLAWASTFSLGLALQHGVNPTTVPWVDYFKAQLKK
ncbi:MAG: SIS domain-containing protein [Patescibacteria group bacterium]|jgi:glucose/mannose-6-phosphate isomerase